MEISIGLRSNFFNTLLSRTPLVVDGKTFKFACPCCGYPALSVRSGFETCFVCDWEDALSGEDDLDTSSIPNHGLTLREARFNYEKMGAIFEKKNAKFREIKELIIEEYEIFKEKPEYAEAIQKRLTNHYRAYKLLLEQEESL